MDDGVVRRVFEEGGRDYFQQPSTSSVLQSLPLHVSFDYGYYLLVKSVQELRERKQGLVTVDIGGPSGSGKTSLADKVASVIGCPVLSMENYRVRIDDGNDPDSIDFDLLILIEVDHLQVVSTPDLQIKGLNKEAVAATGSSLKLDGSYTTKSYLQIVLERLPNYERSSGGVHARQAAKLQELVDFIQAQVLWTFLMSALAVIHFTKEDADSKHDD